MVATALVLVAALLHATWNTLIKFSGERLLVIACMDSVALLFVLLAVGFVSLPPLEIWPWIIASALFELLYRYLLIQAYRVGDLGLVYPLMRGLSPLVVLALTLVFAGEVLSTQQIVGILLIPFGMLCLLWQGGGGERLPWSMLPVVALIGLCIGCYTFLDGQALRRWSHPLDYLVWLTLLSAWPFPLLAMVRKRAAFSLFWRTQWRLGLSVGLCVLLSYALVLWAMQLGSIAEAAALREVSVILVVLFGMRYLKEPFGRSRLLACGLVLIGMLVMKL
ncbi:EamA family transporter [Pseudomonas fluorescens]|uniref:EamA family transporter n=1 Tax=Pseudomonas shahriarae TaxID=2745512 RepID=A0ABT5N5P6_9PSED|nr:MULTISPECIES: EamA family transporter [Pseudomonas]AYG10295.1 EamA family transporter [Pseudomonas fluorescens]MBJ2238977.1 EamA family transporter [Pseudomonas sp. MF6768]MBJ2250113.1 EamA family transporter [Pseudomonas sp. MF6784]MBJ2261808.1 EamA family transporter [Pseudomonas sp. MF6787]MBJ2269469.1 EamA family transporter [Pseudomonas sp. MF6772]NMX34976.1 EamA family transporter [Pseudomonas sp. WS 5413]NMY20244.1 EamA family transporter [Pseudomonas sp. WS 5410]NMY32984.1 EamA f